MTVNLPINFFDRIETLRFVDRFTLTVLGGPKLILVELWFLFANTVRDATCRRSDLVIFMRRHYCPSLSGEEADTIVGDLIAELLASGVLHDADGFIDLVDFAQHNQHLLPHRKTLQQRGGQTKRLRKAWDDAARQGRDLFAYLKGMGAELPEGMKDREDMFSTAWALVSSLYNINGESLRPGSEVPSPELMIPAMSVMVRHRADVRMAVLRYLDARREDDTEVKDPRYILANFDEFAEKANVVGA
jgi:hypothetical protein